MPARRNPAADLRKALSKYKADPEVSIKDRMADLLLFCRKHHPHMFIDFRDAAKICMFIPKKPHRDHVDVKRVQGSVARVRVHLLENHNCGIVVNPGFGMRATVDDDDLVLNQEQQAAKRAVGVMRGLERIGNAVTPGNIRDPRVRELHEGYQRPVKSFTRSKNVEALLATIKDDDDDE